ncbi:MAG: archaeal heat shock protein Hsp20 [Candidatus Bathyarchaeia archaeon]
MAWESDFPSWFRRRRWPFFDDWFFDDFNRMFEEMFKDVAGALPKELVRERRLPDGSTVREVGPIVYGYSMTMGPDGKPVIREFGNVKPSLERGRFGPTKPGLTIKEEREPLVDVITEGDQVRVVAELPGVEKSDINLQHTENELIISVDTPQRKYHKTLELPDPVDPESAKAFYKNGVLEVLLKRRKPSPKGKEIKVE